MLITENKYFYLDRPYESSIKHTMRSLIKRLSALKYKTLITMAKGAIAGEKKYKVSICAIFKDEGQYLEEWIEFHLIVGIEHFYLYNNGSSDNYIQVLKPYIDNNIVTLIDYPGKQMQMKAYEHAISNFRNETKWLGFIDLDEFVVPLKNTNVYEVLREFNNKAPSVLIYWKVFGSSGLMERDDNKLVVEQFLLSYPKLADIGKCFYNTDYEYAFNSERNSLLHHVLWCRSGNNLLPPVNLHNHVSFGGYNIIDSYSLPIQINHYVTKSYKDYYYKTNGKTDVYYENNPRKTEQFFKIDNRCTVQDFSATRFLVKLKVNMGETLT